MHVKLSLPEIYGKDIELNVVKTLYIKYIIDISKKKKCK